MSKHTPGPWSFYTEPQPNGCPIVGSRGLMVCMLAHTVNQPEQMAEAIANARLIAAAPMLLEALIEAERLYSTYGLLSQSSDCGVWINSARAAIAAATGDA